MPYTWNGQLLIIFIIILGLTWIPAQIVTVVEAILESPKYLNSFLPAHQNSGSHIVVTGCIDLEFMVAVMEEVFLGDWNEPPSRPSDETKIVFLSPIDPTDRIKSILLLYKKKIVFLKGRPRFSCVPISHT